MSAAPTDPVQRVREILDGYPDNIVEAGVAFASTRNADALDRLMFLLMAFHRPRQSDRQEDLSKLPGSTRLVADLGFDSLSIVEVNFLITDLLDVQLTDDDLRGLVTLDDLRLILRRRLGLESLS
jgi:acyl carrier protein